MVTSQLQVERRTAKERWPETGVLPLSHADQDGTQFNDPEGMQICVDLVCQIQQNDGALEVKLRLVLVIGSDVTH